MIKNIILILAATLLTLTTRPQDAGEVSIRYIGHSCFLITTSEGVQILTDPVEFKGYHFPKGIKPDIVTVSHNHVDHNRVDMIEGNPRIIYGCSSNKKVETIDLVVKNVRIFTVPSYHDPGKHGVNAIFIFDFDGIRIVHLGDLGTVLSDDQISAIGNVDFLMIPVGGQFTITIPEANQVVEQLEIRRAVFPMHYKTEAFTDLPYSVDVFLQDKHNINRINGYEVKFDLKIKPSNTQIYVLDYKQNE